MSDSAAPNPDSSPFEEPSYESVEKGIGFVDRWHERRMASDAANGRRVDYFVLFTWLAVLAVCVAFWVGVVTLARWAL